MGSTARRLAGLIAGGGLAIAALTGCGAVNAAVDCANVADTMTEVSSNVSGDTETLKASTDKLRSEAEDIEDEGLKASAIDFADQADAVNAGINGDISEGAETDPSALNEALESFTSECNALG